MSLYRLYDIDASLTAAINALSGHVPVLDSLMADAGTIGLPAMTALVGMFWWARTERIEERRLVLTAAGAALLALAFNQVILLLVARVRPYDTGITHLLIGKSADPSFPSDHASVAFALAISVLLAPRFRRGLVLLGVATLIGIARVFVGTHFVGDILGGLATGACGALSATYLYPRGSRIDRAVTQFL